MPPGDKMDQASGFRIVRRHLLKVWLTLHVVGHQLTTHLLHRVQQQDKAVALLLNNRLQGDNSINKLVLAFKK